MLNKKIKEVEQKIKNYNCLVQWKMDELINELNKLKNERNFNN